MEIKDFYEAEHEEYDVEGDKKLKAFKRGQKLYEIAGKPKGLKILDIGPQFGTVTQYFVKDNDVTIVDFNQHAVDYMKKKHGVKGMQADCDGKKLPFKDESFDLVICSEVLEHLFFYEETIAEIARLTKKGGMFIGTTPNAFTLRARIGFLLNRPGTAFNHEHIRFYNKKIIKGLLTKYFSEVKLKGFKGWLKDINLSLFGHLFLWRCIK